MIPKLLIIDDDKSFVNDFILVLKRDFDCIAVHTAGEGLLKIDEINPDVVLLDLMLGEDNGLNILKQIMKKDEDLPVIMITDYASIDTAVEAIKIGAFDYISKIPKLVELKFIIDKSLKQRIIKSRTKYLEEETGRYYSEIIGESDAAKHLKETIALFAANSNTVLITGESGAGKELVARQIHSLSDREKKPFVTINCAAIPKDLLESELFGHERGAFTGAIARKLGKFELASDGTLFLDEVAELDLSAQVKLLRVLQEKEFERVGGSGIIKSQARIIAATNKNLTLLVQQGKFREDLYYRLYVLPVEVPPLRERKEDIEMLSMHFANEAAVEMKVGFGGFSSGASALLKEYNFPGNIRELQNFITRAILLAKGDVIKPEHFFLTARKEKSLLQFEAPETWEQMNELRKAAADNASRIIEKQFLENLLKKFNGNISRAAQHININRSNLHKMIKKCGIEAD